MAVTANVVRSEGLPKVAVTLKPVHSLVAAVMAGAGEPALIVEGSASPHTFTLKPSAARAISNAGVFIRVSEKLEPFTRKISEALPETVTLVTLTDKEHGLALLGQRQSGTFDEHKDDHHDHGHDGAEDGHVWLDPENAKAIVRAAEGALSKKYPAHAAVFAANAEALVARISALSAEVEATLAPVKSKPFLVFHDAFQYFEKRFELAAAGSITMSPDVQPSARRLTDVRKKLAKLGAVCVFAEPGFQPNLVTAVTEGTTARSATLDPEAMTLKPGPELYFDLMRSLAKNIRECLG